MLAAHLRTGLLMLAVAGAGACKATQPLPEVEGGIEVGLKRGSAWTTLKVRPPHIIGPDVNLKLIRGRFMGSINGQAVQIVVDQGGIKGSGPYGDIALEVTDSGPDQVSIEGMWNGLRAHFEITTDTLKGSLAFYQPEMQPGQRSQLTFDRQQYCQYTLDSVTADGRRVGTSICHGMPEVTELDIPMAIQGWLTREELVVVFFTLASSPPFTVMEPGDPRPNGLRNPLGNQ